jgi:hypothetical protein
VCALSALSVVAFEQVLQAYTSLSWSMVLLSFAVFLHSLVPMLAKYLSDRTDLERVKLALLEKGIDQATNTMNNFVGVVSQLGNKFIDRTVELGKEYVLWQKIATIGQLAGVAVGGLNTLFSFFKDDGEERVLFPQGIGANVSRFATVCGGLASFCGLMAAPFVGAAKAVKKTKAFVELFGFVPLAMWFWSVITRVCIGDMGFSDIATDYRKASEQFDSEVKKEAGEYVNQMYSHAVPPPKDPAVTIVKPPEPPKTEEVKTPLVEKPIVPPPLKPSEVVVEMPPVKVEVTSVMFTDCTALKDKSVDQLAKIFESEKSSKSLIAEVKKIDGPIDIFSPLASELDSLQEAGNQKCMSPEDSRSKTATVKDAVKGVALIANSFVLGEVIKGSFKPPPPVVVDGALLPDKQSSPLVSVGGEQVLEAQGFSPKLASLAVVLAVPVVAAGYSLVNHLMQTEEEKKEKEHAKEQMSELAGLVGDQAESFGVKFVSRCVEYYTAWQPYTDMAVAGLFAVGSGVAAFYSCDGDDGALPQGKKKNRFPGKSVRVRRGGRWYHVNQPKPWKAYEESEVSDDFTLVDDDSHNPDPMGEDEIAERYEALNAFIRTTGDYDPRNSWANIMDDESLTPQARLKVMKHLVAKHQKIPNYKDQEKLLFGTSASKQAMFAQKVAASKKRVYRASDVAQAEFQKACERKELSTLNETLLKPESWNNADKCSAVYKIYRDGQYMCSGTHVGNKMIVVQHILSENSSVVYKAVNHVHQLELRNPVLFGDELAVFEVNGIPSPFKANHLRALSDASIVSVLGFGDGQVSTPDTITGFASIEGYCNAHTRPGDCSAPVLDRDGFIVGFHTHGNGKIAKAFGRFEKVSSELIAMVKADHSVHIGMLFPKGGTTTNQ